MADPTTYRPSPGAIPTEPGVYRFRDEHGRVIYVGKAKNLRARLSNYFQDLSALHHRTQTMVTTAAAVEWTVVGTEVEALALEYSWIKEFDPRFNVKYRDDKSYPYLAVTMNEEYPRALVLRGAKKPGTRYFGPYGHAWAIRETLDLLLRVFPIRTCSNGVFRRSAQTGRPCLLGYIDKCSAPCVGRVSEAEHRQIAEDFCDFMAGDTGKFVRRIEKQMRAAAAAQEYELAARLRDDLAALERALEKNAVVLSDATDADIFALSGDDLEAAVQVFHVRGGRIRGQRGWVVEKVEDIDDAALVEQLLGQVYEAENPHSTDQQLHHSDDSISRHSAAAKRSAESIASESTVVSRHSAGPEGSAESTVVTRHSAAAQRSAESIPAQEKHRGSGLDSGVSTGSTAGSIPREVLVPVLPTNAPEVSAWLTGLRGSRVDVRVPQRGDKRELAETVRRNAEHALALHRTKRAGDLTMRSQALQEVQDALELPTAPLRIECYDVSHTQGTYQSASMVVFEDGLPRKSEYRVFSIRGEDGSGARDDTEAMYEVIARRFRKPSAASAPEVDAALQAPPGRRMTTETDAKNTVILRREASAESMPGPSPVVEFDAPATGSHEVDPAHDPARNRRFAYPPSLIIVDGGAPQVAAAQRALDDLGVSDVALCGLAKRLEEVWLPGEEYPVVLPRASAGLYLMQRLRDEAHRFAIKAHRKRRSKGMTTSALDDIPGLGPVRSAALLKHFGSVKRLKAAGIEELAEAPGFGKKTAAVVYAALHPEAG